MRLFLYKSFTFATLGTVALTASFIAGAATHLWAQNTLKDIENEHKSGPILS
jgi:hypothetical protein